MAINFPDTAGQPTNGSYTFTVSGTTYAWDGESWNALGATLTRDLGELTDVDLTTAPTTGEVLKYNGTVWTAAEDSGGDEYLYTRNPSIYEIIGLESWTSIHNAPILFTQALDDPTGATNQPAWLQSYYNEVSGDSNNATATLTTVATGGHAAMNQQTADGVTLQTAIRNFVNSTGSLPNGVGWAFYNITPTGLGLHRWQQQQRTRNLHS